MDVSTLQLVLRPILTVTSVCNTRELKEKESQEDMHPMPGGNLTLGPPERQPIMLTTTLCYNCASKHFLC